MATRVRYLLACLPLLWLSGCSWSPYLIPNLICAPVQAIDDLCFCYKANVLANEAWDELLAHNPKDSLSSAYGHGFRHGFADYLNRNGDGAPPALPPAYYRLPGLRTPEQQRQIEDWFAGFKHGSDVAHEQRWRQGVVVPIARPPLVAPTIYHEIVPVGSAQPVAPAQPAAPAPPNIEELPRPRPPPPPDLPQAEAPARLLSPIVITSGAQLAGPPP